MVDGAEPLRQWDFLGRRVLLAGRFPAAGDGIARYADQLAQALRSGGREVVRIGQDGEIRTWLRGRLRPLRMLRPRGFDDLLVMYHPVYFIGGPPASRLLSYAALLAVTRLRRTTFVVHERDDEPDDGRLTDPGMSRGLAFRLEERLRRRLWGRRVTLVFHTEWERRRFAERFPARGRTERVVEHGMFFASPVEATPAEARERLGLPAGRTLLLCIGFISPHKAYELVIHAVDGMADAELHIVGERMCDYPEVLRYMDELRALVETKPNVRLHEEFVPDDQFDLWIRAADAVVVPYKAASSSGVIPRAHLLGTRVISSGTGGLGDQLRPGDTVFSTDEELADSIHAIQGARVRADA